MKSQVPQFTDKAIDLLLLCLSYSIQWSKLTFTYVIPYLAEGISLAKSTWERMG